MSAPQETRAQAASPDPLTLIRSRGYVVLLVFGALVGIPVAVVAYGFLALVSVSQDFAFETLPESMGFESAPVWWPLPVLALAGLFVGLSLRYFPGTGGHPPAEGFKSGGSVQARELPGIFVAAFITLALGGVLGPEAPLILIGGGLAVLMVHLVKRDAPDQAVLVVGAAGSFAAISTLLVSPLSGAFLMLEVVGIGGGLASVVLAPGLLAAGIGALCFVGLNSITGWGTFSLALPDIPAAGTPTVAELGWAVVIGLVAAVLGTAMRRLALDLQPIIARRKVLLTPAAGLSIGACAVVFDLLTDKGVEQVLFSGEESLAPLIDHAETWSTGALVALMVFKGLAYAISLSCLRGGPTFPGMFIGAAGGVALSQVTDLTLVAAVAMGIGAMTVVMLGGLPLTSVFITLIFLQAQAADLISVVIVAVVVSWVTSARLSRWLGGEPAAREPTPAHEAEPSAR